MTDAWNPVVYERFRDERALPFHDLLALVTPGPIARAVDLGCGTGELSSIAAERLGIGELVGVDSSPAMLARCAEIARPPAVTFEAGDIGSWTSAADHDLVLANASLQWVPDHVGVVRRWVRALRPGGQLAVQVPANADHPSHRIAAEVAAEEPFRSAFPDGPPEDQVARNVLAPEAYAALLHELGFEHQHVALRVYPHVLASTAEVVNWVRGTTLTRFESRLPADVYARFLDRYAERLLDVVGRQEPYFYAFKRILVWGRLPAE